MQERYGMDRSAPALHLRCADDVLRLPVSAFDEHVRSQALDELKRRIFVERGHQGDCFERRNHGSTVVQRIHRAVITFTQPPHGRVGVERYDEACAERTRLGEVSHVAAMENVKYAVREYERPWQCRRSVIQLGRRAELELETRCAVGLPVRRRVHRPG